MDHETITAVLRGRFNALVNRAHDAEEALAALGREGYDLVLVNRIFDRDGDRGLDFIRGLKANQRSATVPVMLVSNYAEAQDAAVEAGALRGFGKAAVDAPDTRELLARSLRSPVGRTTPSRS